MPGFKHPAGAFDPEHDHVGQAGRTVPGRDTAGWPKPRTAPGTRRIRTADLPTGGTDGARSLSSGRPEPETKRVVVVANHPIVQLGLTALLNKIPAILVLQELTISPGAPERLIASRVPWRSVDLVIVDAIPCPAASVELVDCLRRTYEHLRFIVVVGEERYQVIEDLIERGVHGIITASDLFATLPNAVQQVATGQRVIGYDVVAASMQRQVGSGTTAVEDLTLEEIRIMRMVAEGLTNKEIAEREFVSEPTIKRRTQEIYRKLHARDRANAVAVATRLGIL